MGLVFRKRVRTGKTSWINLSKEGASVSKKFGLITVNSRGYVTIHLAPGVSWRIW